MSTAVEAEVVNENRAVVLHEGAGQPVQAAGLWGTDNPTEVVARAAAVATALRDVIVRQKLVSNIQGRDYPRCEAWTLLGTMLGVFPVLCWTRKLEDGWEARVEAKTKDGSVVGAAEAQCLSSERNWGNRDDFALRSMAQTRATAKALRMPLGFVMSLSGFEVTPAEEMTHGATQRGPQPKHAEPEEDNLDFEGATPAKSPQDAPKGNTPHSAPKSAPQPKPAAAPAAIGATEEQKAKLIAACDAEKDGNWRATTYFIEIGALMPNEGLSDLPLRFVPRLASQMRELGQRIADFHQTGKPEKCVWFFDHLGAAPKASETSAGPGKTRASGVPEGAPPSSAKPASKDPEWWRDVIIPVPNKGQKRDDYLRNPQKIGALYEMRHGNDEESQAARQRLFGFLNHFEPKGWTKRSGEQMPPSAADLKFRDALDALAAHMERNGEKL